MIMDSDVIIAGGGLNGGSLALALAQGGFSVIVVNPQPEGAGGDFDGRTTALALTSQRLLAAIGVWGPMRDETQVIRQIKVADGRAGEPPSPFVLEFDSAEIEDGPMGYMAENRHLRAEISKAMIAHPGIRNVQGAVSDHRPDGGGVTVTTGEGETLRAPLLIGCEGRTSPSATRAGIRKVGWRYGQTALTCAVAHERPHDGIAHQLFLPEGPLAILPLTGNRSSVVWSQPDTQARRVMAMNDADYLDMLGPRFGTFLGAISLAGEKSAWPLSLSLAHSFVAPRLALVGDAAHVVHPIAGQGLNAGLKDVAALAEVLVEATRRGEDIGAPDVLARYQRWRRFDVAALAMATDAFTRIFSNDNGLLRLGRDLGMGLVNALAPARRGAIREAAGLTGELPRLLRGRPL